MHSPAKRNFPAPLNENLRSKMTYKRFCPDLGYRDIPPTELTEANPEAGGQLLQCDAHSPQMGPRRYAASRQLLLRDLGLQRRYPIWGLCACPQNQSMLR